MEENFSTKKWRTKNNILIHDGDCYIYVNEICTCGLIHHLMPMDETKAIELFPDFKNQLAKHLKAMDKLSTDWK